jgi:hypothetical protein
MHYAVDSASASETAEPTAKHVKIHLSIKVRQRFLVCNLTERSILRLFASAFSASVDCEDERLHLIYGRKSEQNSWSFTSIFLIAYRSHHKLWLQSPLSCPTTQAKERDDFHVVSTFQITPFFHFEDSRGGGERTKRVSFAGATCRQAGRQGGREGGTTGRLHILH